MPGQTQKIWMYYGNAGSAEGFRSRRRRTTPRQIAALHFAERGTPASDATVNANNAQSASASVESALIGTGARLRRPGRHRDRCQPVAGDPRPVIARTWSMWAKPSAAAQDAVLFTQRDAAADLTIGLAGGHAVRRHRRACGRPRPPRSTPPAGTTSRRWPMVHGADAVRRWRVRSRRLPRRCRRLSGAGVIAATSAQPGAGPGADIQAYSGELDELTIARVARDAAWIATAAINQGTADTLVKFGLDEGGGAGEGGHFAVIVQSVTVDAWVVIGLCALMAALLLVRDVVEGPAARPRHPRQCRVPRPVRQGRRRLRRPAPAPRRQRRQEGAGRAADRPVRGRARTGAPAASMRRPPSGARRSRCCRTSRSPRSGRRWKPSSIASRSR